jgi:hypothetical protein
MGSSEKRNDSALSFSFQKFGDNRYSMNIHFILRQINKDLVPQFEEKLRQHLHTRDKEWLIEQIIRLTLDAHSLEENDRRQFLAIKEKNRIERMARLQSIHLNETYLIDFLGAYSGISRESFIHDGYLRDSAPEKGSDLIHDEHRTAKGNELLMLAKDVLFGLLYGDDSTHTEFHRTEREMLTLTLPRFKANALDFMKASTELNALGTWQDPHSVSNDSRADNVILEVEFGEIAGEWIGKGVIMCLSIINNLEVNEHVLYGRMINVEQSTLIS